MLVEHARRELQLAGLFDSDADYGGLLAESVVELMEVFAKQGHSGYSAQLTIDLFSDLARFKTLTPITSEPTEWIDRSDVSEQPTWQSTRCPSVFSKDGGATWYDLDVLPGAKPICGM